METAIQETAYEIKTVDPATLTPHPRNYREHPDDQLQHIIARIHRYGVYKDICTARGGVVLIGHGVTKALVRMGRGEITVRQYDLDPDDMRAIELLTGDNETAHLAVVDDRVLSELLKEINDTHPDGLEGTGYDEMMLANLLMVTRPASEIKDFDAAAEWVGMPEYAEGEGDPLKLILSFEDEEGRAEAMEKLGIEKAKKNTGSATLSSWYPPKERSLHEGFALTENGS